MSVTFKGGMVLTGRWTLRSFGDMGEYVVGEYDSYEAAADAFRESDTDDVWMAPEDVTESLPSVNVSNGNAHDVLLALDLPTDDLCGSEDAVTFRARVLLALATDRLDDERPSFVERGEMGATLHYCGREAGYVNARLSSLLAVAEAAENYGVPVVWG